MIRGMPRQTWALAVAVAAAVLAWQLAAAQAPAPVPPIAQVTFRLIVASTEVAARDVLERLRRGAEADRSRLSSRSIRRRFAAALIGPVVLADLRGELRDALAALRRAATSGVIRLPTGFGVVQLAEPRRAARCAPPRLPALLRSAPCSPPSASTVSPRPTPSCRKRRRRAKTGTCTRRQICDVRRSSMSEMVTSMTELTAEMKAPGASPGPDPVDIIQADVILGQIHAYDGRMAETIARFEQAIRARCRAFPRALAQLEEMLGVAHLHKAEMDNGVYRTPGDRCLLSPKPAALADPRGARTAIDYFTKALARRPGDGELTWLLNLAHMAAGSYPAGVPAAALDSAGGVRLGREHRPLHRRGRPRSASTRSRRRAAWSWTTSTTTARSRSSPPTSTAAGAMQLFRRGADGRFHDQAARAGLAGELGGLNLLQADYDNDGCKDVLVLRGGWEQPQRKSLLRNNCDGTFTDVTVASGLASPATSTQTAAWADIDNDGFARPLRRQREPAVAAVPQHGQRARSRTSRRAAGVARAAFTKGVAAADYDNDGDVDFYLSNLGGGNFLYRNNGNRTFTEVSEQAGVPGPERGFPTWFFDYDNDGWDDLLVSSYFLSVDETARRYLRRPPNAGTMKLYRNLGNGTFADVTAQAGLDRVYMPMGSNFGDVDNDGYPDIYLGTGSPSYAATVRACCCATSQGRRSSDVTASSGTGELHKGHGVAFADIDGDGDLDIAFKVGGATPGDAHAFRLFANPGHGRDWLGLDLVGTRTNRAAIGARIAVTVHGATARRARSIAPCRSGGSFGASPLQQHIGLGDGAGRVDVDITWPATGVTQRFSDVPRNQILRVREGDERFTTVVRSVSGSKDPQLRAQARGRV